MLRRGVWLVCVCALAFPAGQASLASASERGVAVVATTTTVTFSWTTTQPTHSTLEVGTDSSYGLVVDEKSGARTAHHLAIAGLKPVTTYVYRLRQGSIVESGTFDTSPLLPATLSSARGRFLVDGQPFFPISAMVTICPTQAFVDGAVGIGVNVAFGYGFICSDPKMTDPTQRASAEGQTLHALLQGRAWWHEYDPNIGPHPSGLTETLQTTLRLFGNTGVSTGFIQCKQDSLAPLYDSTRRAASGSKAVIADVPLALHLSQDWTNCLDGPRTKALIWTAIAAGAQSINYHTQSIGNDYRLFDLAPAVEQQAKEQMSRLATLQPVVLTGERLPLTTTSNATVKVGAWRYGRVIYIVAVNTANTNARATVKLPGPAATQARVLWESRTVPVGSAAFSDSFAGYGVHIYMIAAS